MKKSILTLLLLVAVTSIAFSQKVYTPKLASTFLNEMMNIYYSIGYNGKYYLASKNYLWVSDGTASGTQKLYTFPPNPSSLSDNICWFGEMNGKLFMVAKQADSLGWELWVTDGTTSGTHIVKDINPFSTYFDGVYNGQIPVIMNNHLYFYASDGTHGIELWQSDGTEAGTNMVIDLNTTAPNEGIIKNYNLGGSPALTITAVPGKVFFSANDGISGPALWVTDGTAQGTTQVKTFTNSAGPQCLMPLGNRVVFELDDYPNAGLYISDGTTAGTNLLRNDVTVHTIGKTINNTLFFYGDSSTVPGLCFTDGTPAGTYWTNKILPYDGFLMLNPIAVYKDKFYFAGTLQGANNFELCTSDGTINGTTLFKDLLPGMKGANPYSSEPIQLNVFGDKLYMRADDTGRTSVIWQTDGTVAGTIPIIYPGTDVTTLPAPGGIGAYSQTNLTPAGNKLFFWNTYKAADDASLYYLDMFPDNVTNVTGVKNEFIYPNPASGKITLSKELKDVSIYNATGQELIYIKELTHSVQVKDLPFGAYIISGQDESGQKFSEQFLKQ